MGGMVYTLPSEWLSYRGLRATLGPRSSATLNMRNRIFRQNYRLACKISKRYNNQCPGDLEELTQEAGISLLKVIDRFDPLTGNAFSSYAVPRMWGDLQHYTRDHRRGIRVPRSWTEIVSAIKKYRAECRKQNPAAQPTEEQTAAYLESNQDLLSKASSYCRNYLKWNPTGSTREALIALVQEASAADGLNTTSFEDWYSESREVPELESGDRAHLLAQINQGLAKLENPHRRATWLFLRQRTANQIVRHPELKQFQLQPDSLPRLIEDAIHTIAKEVKAA